MALITGSDVDFVGDNSDPWPGAGGTVWDTYTYRGTTPSYIHNNIGVSGGANYTHQRFMKSGAQPSTADYEIRGTTYFGSQIANDRYQFIYTRMATGEDTAYRFAFGSTLWSIFRIANGTWTPINSGSLSLTKGASHNWKFSVEGTGATVTLIGTINDVEIFNETDTHTTRIVAQGFAGISGFSSGTTGIGCSSFELHTLSAAALTWSTVPDQAVVTGTTPSLDWSNYVTGGVSPYTFTMTSGSETLTGSSVQTDGTFSGNATTDETKELQVDVEDSDSPTTTVSSNVVTFTVSSTADDPPNWHTTVPDMVATEGVARNDEDLSTYCSDNGTITFAGGTNFPVDGITVTTAGFVQFTHASLTAGTYNVTFTADDGVNPVVHSNSVTITVNAASTVGTITTPEMRNNAGTLLKNETAVKFRVYNQTTGALVQEITGETTDSSAISVFSHANIVASTTYDIVIILSSGAIGIFQATAT